ncbi:hypothetical protein FD754_000858, partial [Muntiacus muntjak]
GHLFRELDSHQDGRGISPEGDAVPDGSLDLEEFILYLQEQERRLLRLFHRLDRDQDGRIDVSEIQQSFRALGISTYTMAIDWQEWRDHFLLHSLDNMEDVLYFWKYSTVLDIGECLTISDELSEQEKLTSMWWKQLVAGAVAGAMSRRGTAPLDGLKRRPALPVAGNGINVLKIAPELAIKQQDTLHVQGRFVAGCLAGATSPTIIYPMEVLKMRLTLQGPRAFDNGYLPKVLGIIPYEGWVRPSNHLIFCRPLLLLPSIFPASGSFPMSLFFSSGGQIWTFLPLFYSVCNLRIKIFQRVKSVILPLYIS